MPDNVPYKQVTWELSDIRILGIVVTNPDPTCQPSPDNSEALIAEIRRKCTPVNEIEYCEEGLVYIDRPDREETTEQNFVNTIYLWAHDPTNRIICPTFVRFSAKLTKKTTLFGECFPSYVVEGSESR